MTISSEEASLVVDALEYQLASLERQTAAKKRSPELAAAYATLHRRYQTLLHKFREMAGQVAMPLEPEPTTKTKR